MLQLKQNQKAEVMLPARSLERSRCLLLLKDKGTPDHWLLEKHKGQTGSAQSIKKQYDISVLKC